MASKFNFIVIIAILCSVAQAAYVASETFSNLDCTGTLSQANVFPTNKCIPLPNSRSQKFECVDNRVKAYTCSDANCATCTTRTDLPCTTSSGKAAKCYSSLPAYSGAYLRQGIFTDNTCTTANTDAFEGNYCAPQGPMKLVCDGAALKQYECSTGCNSCDSFEANPFFRIKVTCDANANRYFNYTCIGIYPTPKKNTK